MADSETSDISNPGRRRWLATSAALVAGTVGGRQAVGQEASAAPDAAQLTPALVQSVERDLDPARFRAWNVELKRRAAGRESGFVDLDAVDHNLKRIRASLGEQISLRFVAKSLPSLDLLDYVMNASASRRVMAFSEGMVGELLGRFGSSVDILLGRPAAAAAAARVIDGLAARATDDSGLANVRWLVDTPQRMGEYGELAQARKQVLSVAVELDVGLRRGGAADNETLQAMLEHVAGNPHLQLAGFMGYDGHVPFAAVGGLTPEAEFSAVLQRYAALVDFARETYPELFSPERAADLVFNSGGSRTYHLYDSSLESTINDVALGSALLLPGNFRELPDAHLRASAFLATPVLKRIDPARTPFDPEFLPGLAQHQPALQVANFMTAGDFPGDPCYPQGLTRFPPPSENPARGVINLLPNQGQWLSPRSAPLEVGDFIFYQPWEADAVRWLRYLEVFRGDKLIEQWPTFQPGIALT